MAHTKLGTVSYIELPHLGDSGPETAYVENGEVLFVLNGDFRKEVKSLIKSGASIKNWFAMMEMEWGSSWSKSATREIWLIERDKNTGNNLKTSRPKS
jgi:spermidine/putrescine-binding protein